MNKKIKVGILVCIMAIISVLLVACSNTPSTEYDTVKTTKMNNFTLLNENYAKDGQVVMIGDSIVELFPTYELYAEYDKTVYNRGISGDTSDRLVERLETNALNIHPATLIVLIGTNDIGRGISHDIILQHISNIIDMSKASGVANIVIQSLYPVNKSLNPNMVGRRTNKEIKELNAKIKDLCGEKQVAYANVFDSLIDSEGNFDKNLSYDGLHPNANGYIKIKEALDEYIK